MPIRSLTEPASWTVGDIQAALTDPQSKRLELPKFQRTIVWSAEQRQELIRSLRAGHPVGSLLLFERVSSASIKTYQLVDGLQRVTAIRDYIEGPLAYMAEGGIDDTLVDKLSALLQGGFGRGVEADSVRHAVQSWMRTTSNLKAASGFTPHNLVASAQRELEQDLPAPLISELSDELAPVFDDIKEEVEIGGVSIPVLLFRGEASDLPDIFEKLNSAGTTLSKYEIYAATWVDQDTVVANPSIRDAIDLKYQELIDKGYEIAGLDEPGFSLFEYLFGLGKVLGTQFPLLFGSPTESATPEAIAFTLMTVAHQVEIPDMKTLPQHLRVDADAPIDPLAFEEALFKAVTFVEDLLRPCIGLKLNEKGRSNLVVHTQFQIASIICRVLAATHEPFTWTERTDAAEDIEILKRTLRKHYLVDLVRGTWRSAGDTRVFRQTWTREEAGGLRPSPLYLYDIPLEELNQALDVWFTDQLQRNQKERASVRSVDKLFLKFVYSDVVTVFDSADKTFELEHLFPVSRLAEIVRDEEEGWPISAISNLALFESKLNREKSKKTISEYLAEIPDADVRASKEAEISRYLLCDVSAVSIPQDPNGRDSLSRDAYESFLRSRFEEMKRLALKTLGMSVQAS